MKYALWPRTIWAKSGAVMEDTISLYGEVYLCDTLKEAQDALAALSEEGIDTSQYILTGVTPF